MDLEPSDRDDGTPGRRLVALDGDDECGNLLSYQLHLLGVRCAAGAAVT
ncbi:MAG: hypothetical protein R3C10_26485 [Pirellulales bacterium]